MNLRLTLVFASLLSVAFPAISFSQSFSLSHFALLGKFPPKAIPKLKGGKADADGMVSHNTEGAYLGAEYQRGGMDTLLAGAVTGNKDWIEEGFKVANVTFAKQDDQGGFGDKVPTGAAFWITSLARAFLVLEESPLGADDAARMQAFFPKIEKALDFLSQNRDKLVKHDRNTPNRLLIDADAFFLSSKLLGKDMHLEDARALQALGLKLFDPDQGVFLENGGGDTSYQAVNLLMLIYYDLYYPSPDIESIIKKGETWELSKLQPDGTMDVSTNTRTGKGQEIYFGRAKGVNYREVMEMFDYYGVLFNDPTATEAGEKARER